VPLPGLEVKLAPVGQTRELRVRGPAVTPGYLHRPDLTHAAFDDEGYYRTGDVATLLNPADPNQGFAFDGRIAEDFKLDTGTFVRVAALRTALLSTIPLLSDAVIVGENRPYITALAWLNDTAATTGATAEPAHVHGCLTNPDLTAHIAALLAKLNHGTGSAARIERLILLADPPDLDAGEITDKGYINQRRVLNHRSALVERLYQTEPDPAVIIPKTAPRPRPANAPE
jgi:feruloyl-CoA synthase